MTEVIIDPNVRAAGNETFAAIDDVVGPLSVGATVTVVEPEAELRGQGVVTRIDLGSGLIYLAVDWASLRQIEPSLEQRFADVLQGAGINYQDSAGGASMSARWGRTPHLPNDAYFVLRPPDWFGPSVNGLVGRAVLKAEAR